MDSVNREHAPSFPMSAGLLPGSTLRGHLPAFNKAMRGEPTTTSDSRFLRLPEYILR